MPEESGIFRNEFFFLIYVMIKVLSKHGGKEEDIKRIIDLKSQLREIKNKFYDLKVVPLEEQNKNSDGKISFFQTVVFFLHDAQDNDHKTIKAVDKGVECCVFL